MSWLFRPIQFGIVITAWQLPFCMMIIDCLSVRPALALPLRYLTIPIIYVPDVLQQQSIGAAWPHVLGIFSGHLYQFLTQVWPALGGRAYFAPPQWVLDRLGGPPASNVAGMDFRKPKQQGSSSLNRAKKRAFLSSARKGRKLD